MSEEVKLFLIDMSELPPAGPAHMIVRATTEDREMIGIAASLLGIKQADFLRSASVAAARKVIQERKPA